MKKGGFIAIFLTIVLVFSTAQFISAANLEVGFSGPYTERDVKQLRDIIGWEDDPNVFICSDYYLWEGVEITDYVSLPDNTRSWLFHAGPIPEEGEPPVEDTITGFEVWSEAHFLIPGPQIHVESPDDVYWEWADPPEGDNDLQFGGDPGIDYCTWFDIYVTGLDEFDIGDLNPNDIEVHPTPVPGALLLLGSGFVGLVGLRRFRRT